MRVAYVTGGFPVSFVTSEVECHRRAGWEILPLSSCKPYPVEHLSATERQWRGRTIYRPGLLTQLAAIVREKFTHPIRYAKVWLLWVRIALASPADGARALYELGMACYSAGLVRRFGARHLHVHFASRPLSLGLMIGLLTGLPVSCTAHAFDIFSRSAASLRVRLRRCAFIAAISAYNIAFLREHCGAEIARLCHIVHCGVDLDKFRTFQRHPVPGRLVAISWLTVKKGLDVAVEACARLRDQKVDFEFQVIGDGPVRPELEERVRAYHLEDRVKMLGPVPNDQLAPLLAEACAFVLPCVTLPSGNQDGIPVAMMEAMACEVPVVSTAVSGNPELVENGIAGFLVPQRDPAALADALKRLLGDMDMVERFGKASRRRVAEEFSAAVNAARLRELIAGAGAATVSGARPGWRSGRGARQSPARGDAAGRAL